MTEEEMTQIIIEDDVFESLIDHPEWYTVEEVAERLKVRASTVRDWLRAGRLKGAKFGELWRIEGFSFRMLMAKAKRFQLKPVRSWI